MFPIAFESPGELLWFKLGAKIRESCQQSGKKQTRWLIAFSFCSICSKRCSENSCGARWFSPGYGQSKYQGFILKGVHENNVADRILEWTNNVCTDHLNWLLHPLLSFPNTSYYIVLHLLPFYILIYNSFVIMWKLKTASLKSALVLQSSPKMWILGDTQNSSLFALIHKK